MEKDGSQRGWLRKVPGVLEIGTTQNILKFFPYRASEESVDFSRRLGAPHCPAYCKNKNKKVGIPVISFYPFRLRVLTYTQSIPKWKRFL